MKWICALFALVLIAIVTAADAGIAEPMFEIVRRVPWGDKLAHLLLLGVMSLLLNVSLEAARFRWGRLRPLKGTAILLVLAILEEVSQLAFEHRTFSYADLAANVVGIVTFGWLAVLLLHHQRAR